MDLTKKVSTNTERGVMENENSCCHFQAELDVCSEDDTTELQKEDCGDDCKRGTNVMNMKCDMILLLLSYMIWTWILNKKMARDFFDGENMAFGSLKDMTNMNMMFEQNSPCKFDYSPKNNGLEAIIGGKHKFICA